MDSVNFKIVQTFSVFSGSKIHGVKDEWVYIGTKKLLRMLFNCLAISFSMHIYEFLWCFLNQLMKGKGQACFTKGSDCTLWVQSCST